jgi:hypothetical protein
LGSGDELRCVCEKLPNTTLDPERQRDDQKRGKQKG